MENKHIDDLLVKAERRKSCSRPRQIRNQDGTVSFVKCQSKIYAECPACATIYATDQKRLIGSGCNPSERDGVTEEIVSEYRYYFVTLTAPGFGAIHRVPKTENSPEHPCSCGKTHKFGSKLRGTPVNEKWYKYKQQIAWNVNSSDLFKASIKYMTAQLPDVEWAFAREWQVRGALHFHGIIRVPNHYDSAETYIALQKLAKYKKNGFGWGTEFQLDLIADDSSNSVRYMSKVVSYTAKQQGDEGVISETRRKFYDRLDKQASKIICGHSGCKGDGTCQGKAHRSFGYAGQMVTRSKGWSFVGLTQTDLVNERKDYAVANKESQQYKETLRVLAERWDEERRSELQDLSTGQIDADWDKKLFDSMTSKNSATKTT